MSFLQTFIAFFSLLMQEMFVTLFKSNFAIEFIHYDLERLSYDTN